MDKGTVFAVVRGMMRVKGEKLGQILHAMIGVSCAACGLIEDGTAEESSPESIDSQEDGVPDSHALVFSREPLPDDDCLAERVYTGANHVCAVTERGALYCWGSNSQRGLGVIGGEAECAQNGSPCIILPLRVPGVSGVKKAALGLAHTCILDAAGVACWGNDEGGYLGARTDRLSECEFGACSERAVRPTALEGAADVDAWGGTCAIDAKGQALCWGGDGVLVPTPIEGIEDARVIDHTCALTGEQSIQCWGRDQVAYGVSDFFPGDQISTGYNGGCGFGERSGLLCWGLDKTWSDGVDACNRDSLCEVSFPEFEFTLAQVSLGLNRGWVRSDTGVVSEIEEGVVTREINLPAPAIDVSAGYSSACAVLDDGRVSCWGRAGSLLGYSQEPTTFGLCDAYQSPQKG